MSDLTLILLSAGSSTRFELVSKKQWLRIGDKPLWQFVADNFKKIGFFDKIIITASKDELDFMKNYAKYHFVAGGKTRQESLKNALSFVDSEFVLVSDVARCCINKDFLEKIISQKETFACVVPYLKVTDTIVYDDKTIDRDKVKKIQTPQLSHTKTLKEALKTSKEFTDESSAIVANGGKRIFIDGDNDAHKLTYLSDIDKLPCLTPPSHDILSGNGFDVHEFENNSKMFLGGIEIEVGYGFKAHSDGDVAIHALIDALLGAAGLGDIGTLFPDNDEAYKGADSKELLREVVSKLHNFGFEIVNADITIIAQKPKIAPYKFAMREVLSELLHVELSRVNVKATTTEKLGFIGRSEGVAVIANANLRYFDWTKK